MKIYIIGKAVEFLLNFVFEANSLEDNQYGKNQLKEICTKVNVIHSLEP